MCGGINIGGALSHAFSSGSKALATVATGGLNEVASVAERNNPVARKKRLADEALTAQNQASADAQSSDAALQVRNNQALQAEAVATRRRRAAQSLLRQGNPALDMTDGSAGPSNLARGQAYSVRPSLG